MRTVFINGCFDLLHPGHIYFIKEARKRGDKLIVGLNLDSKKKSLYYSYQERKAMLEALESVDFVVGFPQETAENLVEVLKPDVYVTASEYKGVSPEAKAVLANGGRVFYVDRVGDYASSMVREALK